MEAKERRFLLQTTGSLLGVTLDSTQPDGGLVLSGGESELSRLRGDHPELEIYFDSGAWRDSYASPSWPVSHGREAGLFQLPMEEALAQLLSAGATYVLSPTLTIRGGDFRSLRSSIAFMEQHAVAGLIPFLPLATSWLGRRWFAGLLEMLTAKGRPHFVTWVGGAVNSAEKAANLRTLVGAKLVTGVLNAEPLVASDALVHGALVVSSGATRALRLPGVPGSRPTKSLDFLPGVFYRTLFETVASSRYADWYAGQGDAICTRCGSLSAYTQTNIADRLRILEHNTHAVQAFADSVCELPPELAAMWLAAERARALAAHPSELSREQADATLVALVDLDGAEPVSILDEVPVD